MDNWKRHRIETAVRLGWHDVVADEGATLYRREDLEELKEIIRTRAPRFDYRERGQTMYYDGDVEIDTRMGVRGTGR